METLNYADDQAQTPGEPRAEELARRQNGYFPSSLTGGEKIKINGNPLGNRTIRLNRGDTLEIDHNQLLFYV